MLAEPKTKAFIEVLSTLGLDTAKTLIVDSPENDNLLLASRNVKRAKVVNSFGLNIYDLLYHEKLIVSRAAVEELNELLNPNKKNGAAEEKEAAGETKSAAVDVTEEAA
ncbi:MAG TPA: 50S ribosomal protein L4, partial [Pyrinomonadaceae bacterium]|nr:50S ribosomal protein L4 [Pyrinomonadaceae bacterium]